MFTVLRGLGLTEDSLHIFGQTAVATMVSLLVARGLKMPAEFYWAPISTIVILLSTIDPSTLPRQRFAGTALGAFLGAVIATCFHPNRIIYGMGIFLCGMLSALLRITAAFRFAAIAVSTVLARSPSLGRRHRPVYRSLRWYRGGVAGDGDLAPTIQTNLAAGLGLEARR